MIFCGSKITIIEKSHMYIRMQERKKREKFEKLRNNPHNRQLFDEHLAQLPPSAIQEDSCCEVYSREFSKLMEPTKWLYRKSESYWEDKEKGDIRKKCIIIPRCCDLIACKLRSEFSCSSTIVLYA